MGWPKFGGRVLVLVLSASEGTLPRSLNIGSFDNTLLTQLLFDRMFNGYS